MKRLLIFGNSGSGKSTLARTLQDRDGLSHLDLDTLAWLPSSPPERRRLSACEREISEFIGLNQNWVIEGCYADLLDIALPSANELIFLNLPIEDCIENARNRSWEPHKYDSMEAQNANLEMLISWISKYADRTDTFSHSAHRKLYDDYRGAKHIYTSNDHND